MDFVYVGGITTLKTLHQLPDAPYPPHREYAHTVMVLGTSYSRAYAHTLTPDTSDSKAYALGLKAYSLGPRCVDIQHMCM